MICLVGGWPRCWPLASMARVRHGKLRLRADFLVVGNGKRWFGGGMRRLWTIVIGTIVVVILFGLIAFWFEESEGPEHTWSLRCDFHPKVSGADEKRISEIINTLADTSVFGLAFKKSHLEKLGDQVHADVPPLEFLAYIFHDQHLANQMGRIQKSSFKYDNFLEGMQPGMIRESEMSCFEKKTKDFAKYLELDPDVTWKIMKKCVARAKGGDSKGFKAFVNYLIQRKSKIKQKEEVIARPKKDQTAASLGLSPRYPCFSSSR